MHSKIGCLLIHGFGGSPDDIRPLAEFLLQKDILVLCPTLKGHTGRKSDLRGITYHQWIHSAKEGMEELSIQCDSLVLIGFSMGGLISVSLPYSSKVRGIVFLNTPIYLWNLNQICKNIIMDVRKRTYEHIRFYADSFRRIPISAALEFLRFLFIEKHNFRKQKYPVFIGQALEDDTVNPKSAKYIYQNCLSDDKLLRYYHPSDHLICHSKATPALFEDILMFVQNCCNK